MLQCVLQNPLLRQHLQDICKHPPEDSSLCFWVLFLCVSTSALKMYFVLFRIRAPKSLHNDNDNETCLKNKQPEILRSMNFDGRVKGQVPGCQPLKDPWLAELLGLCSALGKG